MKKIDKNDRQAARQHSKKRLTILALLIAVLVLLGVGGSSLYVGLKMGQIDLGLHGWIALIAGAVGTIVLGCGLMALSFYSNRSGHDEQAWTDPEKHRDLSK